MEEEKYSGGLTPDAENRSSKITTRHNKILQWCLKYCTAFSWASAACLLEKVPRLRRFPVLAFFLREYKRYWPDLSLRIMDNRLSCAMRACGA